jgi:glycosyltransferase involved in cell wall biosynthesis
MIVSAIVNCYNQGKYLQKALDSILNQTYKSWELKIMLDGCTDNSQEIAEEFEFSNPKKDIEIIKLDDIGPSKSRHTGILESVGDAYFVLDADDWIGSRFIENTLIALAETNRAFVYVDTVYYFEKENRYQRVPSPDYSFFNLIQNNFMSYCSLIMRDAYDDVGGYDFGNFAYTEDYELYTKLGMKGYYGYHLVDDLFYYCVHDNSSFQSERAKKLLGVYKCYMVTQMPEIYPIEWQREAKKIMAQYPKDFMSLTPKQQEEFIK